METVVGTLVGIAVGGLTTWLVSRHYYKKAGDELRQEAESLRKLQEMTIYALTNPGAKLQEIRDSHGNIVGLDYPSAGRTGITTSLRGELTIEPKPKGPDDMTSSAG